MKRIRLCIVGGFLGSGKTTAIACAAHALLGMGMTVGVVTNDQGSDLVDTGFLQSEGLNVLEVTGGCFCCNFDQFMSKVDVLAGYSAPDIILAEPVGSCTDLVATILKPLSRQQTERFVLSPFTALADPLRVKRLMLSGASPFPSEINYLFRKQLEEADVILLNKSDTLAEEERASLAAFLIKAFPGARVLPVSALTGEGVTSWLAEVMDSVFADKASLDIDYDAYGRAEQYLGWLNRTCEMTGADTIDCSKFICAVLEGMRESLRGVGEIAHIKAYAAADGACVKAGITARDIPVSPPQGDKLLTKRFRLLVNARACASPAQLETAYETALSNVCAAFGASSGMQSGDAFVPGWPRPKYRIND